MTKIIPQMKQLISDQSGAVAIIVAITLFVLFGFAAFAIDFGYSYGIKNKLQNAADSASLAGASVLFSSNQRCLAFKSPYDCCTDSNTGTCVEGTVDVNNVNLTAQALATANHSGGSETTVLVEIGHYAFADVWGLPGTFSPVVNGNYVQMSNWQSMTFDALNDRADFINAVKVTISRSDIPRFFSRIWSQKNDLGATVEAIAYVGFSGRIDPLEADQPIAICEDTLKNEAGDSPQCSIGTMLNDNTQTARWTDFVQDTETTSCGNAKNSGIESAICSGNTTPVIFGEGISTTNGTINKRFEEVIDCWQKAQYDFNNDGIFDTVLDTDLDGRPEHPWKILLPVIDCSDLGCSPAIGSVVVNVVWINSHNSEGIKNSDGKENKDPWIPRTMYNPHSTEVNKYWSCQVGAVDETTGHVTTPTECWESFRDEFNLLTYNPDGTNLPAEWGDKTIYFIPECDTNIPTGATGGQNFGVMAQFPVLVK